MIQKKNIRSLDDFEAGLSIHLPLGLKPPEILLGEDDYKEISETFTITAKYRSTDWFGNIEAAEIQTDLIRLQAAQIDLLRKHGVLIGFADSIEEQLKISRSKILVQGKNLKKKYEDAGDIVKVTLTDIKELSITKTEDIWKTLTDYKCSADFVKFVYFAVKDMVAYLDKVVHRLYSKGEHA